MAEDSVTLPNGDVIITDLVGGKEAEIVKVAFGDSSAITRVTTSAGLPIGDGDSSLPDIATKLDTLIGLLGTATASQVWKSWAVTTTQTGAAIWTPGSGKKIALDLILVDIGGTTGGDVTLWFGASGDTTYTAGTDQVVMGPWPVLPSATVAPFKVIALPRPIIAATADHILRLTTSAGITCNGVCYGYEL